MVMPDKIRVDTKILRATEPRSRLSDGQQNLVILLSGGKSTCPGLTDKWNFEPCILFSTANAYVVERQQKMTEFSIRRRVHNFMVLHSETQGSMGRKGQEPLI